MSRPAPIVPGSFNDPVAVQQFIDWARAGGHVLSRWHVEAAQALGIDTTGVQVHRLLPVDVTRPLRPMG